MNKIENNGLVTFDFLEIVLEGYCDPIYKVQLSDYFLAEFKKAKDYGFTSFFGHVLRVLDSFEEELTNQYNSRKIEYVTTLNRIEANQEVLTPGPGYTEEELRLQAISYYKSEIKYLELDEFTVILNGKFCGLLHYWEIQFMRASIKFAQFKSKVKELSTYGSFCHLEDKTNFSEIQVIEESSKEILEESVQNFEKEYPKRMKMFTEKYKASEKDFILMVLLYLEKVLYDLKVREIANDGYPIKNFQIFDYAVELSDDLSFERFCYITNCKIDFLRNLLKDPGSSPATELETFSQLINDANLCHDQINVFCNTMPFNIPKEHFAILKEKKSTNGGPFLTEERFNAFIDKAFYGKTDISKQKLNQSKGEKFLLQAVFYDFYFKYCFEYFNTMQCRDRFIRLLTDNFEGWDFKKVKANFKPKTDKRL